MGVSVVGILIRIDKENKLFNIGEKLLNKGLLIGNGIFFKVKQKENKNGEFDGINFLKILGFESTNVEVSNYWKMEQLEDDLERNRNDDIINEN